MPARLVVFSAQRAMIRHSMLQRLMTPEGMIIAAVTLSLTLFIFRPRKPRTTSIDGIPGANTRLVKKFRESMVINYERWHEGIGYDLSLLRSATPEECAAIETILLREPITDWRPVEALHALHTTQCLEKLKSTFASSTDHEVKLAITQYAGEIFSPEERSAAIISALKEAPLIKGLTAALRQIPQFHPPEIIAQLLDSALHREGESAIHCAAMVLFLHGKADSIFDNAHMSFLTRFCLKAPGARAAAYEELCQRIGVTQ